ncbi:MAG TPA: hypothetical protein VEU08_24960 [Vicinamibacterales bacterium]|nr:hypothetical protein [Vicinamibacterales bacterium]
MCRALLIGIAVTSAVVAAQPRFAAHTVWGDPDLEGVWNYATMTPLERPREFADRAVLAAADAATYEQRTNERQASTNNTAGPDCWDPGTRHLTNRRTSLIVDPENGRMPPLTADAEARAAARAQARRGRGPTQGPEDLELNVRCLQWATAGPPMLPGVYNNDVQILQTRDHVVLLNEMIHDARIVPMDGRPHGAAPRWMGDSRGRWDGASLVIETTQFSDRTSFRGSDDHLRLVERFTRSDRDTIEYRFTVDDPTVWTRPWTAMFPMHRSDGMLFEYACHEGNFRSIEGLLRAARLADQK